MVVGFTQEEESTREEDGFSRKKPKIELSSNSKSISNENCIQSNNQSEDKEDIVRFDPPLWQQRRKMIRDLLMKHLPNDRNTLQLLDLGCGNGKYIRYLLEDYQFIRIIGIDVAISVLDEAKEYLKPKTSDYLQLRSHPLNIQLFYGSILKKHPSFRNMDAAICIEVIEHLPISSLTCFEKSIFGYHRPRLVIISTPNRDYNVLFGMHEDEKRDLDHKFEWNQMEFQSWSENIALTYDYTMYITGVGILPDKKWNDCTGYCTQIAVFCRKDEEFVDKYDTTSTESSDLNSFQLVANIDYPYDQRTRKEKILDEMEAICTSFLIQDEDGHTEGESYSISISVEDVMNNSLFLDLEVTREELCQILEANNYTLNESKTHFQITQSIYATEKSDSDTPTQRKASYQYLAPLVSFLHLTLKRMEKNSL